MRLKALNSFFQLSWKEKTWLLSAANIEYKNFEEQILFCPYKSFFGVFYPFLRKSLTEQSFSERSSLRKLKKWMGFCVLKALNSFFQLSWKEKTCLLSAANIEYKNFGRKNSSLCLQAGFWYFLRFPEEILKGAKKSLKNAINQPIWSCRNF